MKGNKALYKTKDDLSTNITSKDVNGLNQLYGNAKEHITTLKPNHNANKDLQNENVCSHVTCTCADEYRGISYFKTNLSETQSKNYYDAGVGSVKKILRQNVQKLYIPKTQERAVGTLDVPILKYNSEDFNGIETFMKTDRSKGSSYKRFFLNQKLSPLFKTKSIYANPNAISLQNNKVSLHYKSFKDKFVNASTQLNSKELNKTRKIKIFKEFAVNTGSVVNLNLKESETEASIDLSTVLNNKNISYVNSLDSLMQHVYSLDKRRFEGNLSRILIDPMENILEREYRKIFSIQSRDCLCTKDSASNFLPRRFEDLRGRGSRNVLLKYTSETSSHLTEPSCKDVSITFDPPCFNSLSKNIENNSIFFPNDISEKGLVEAQAPKINTNTSMKTKISSKWRHSAVEEGDNRGMKRIFKMWGKKQDAEGDFNKKSKLKCCLYKRSERSVKSTKLSNNKSVDKKERNKFHIFKKRDKERTLELKPKKVVTSGRCEIRQELILKIGKSYSKQDHQFKFLGSMRRSMYQSLINARDSIASDSNSTNTLLYNINSTANTMSLLHKGRSSITDISRQCIQAWIIPNIILDKFIKAKIKCNLKCEKYHKSSDSTEPYETTISKPKTSMATNKTIFTCNTCAEKKLKTQSKCIMFDIALSCSSEYDNNSYISKDSDEKVYNIVDYETSFPNSVGSKKIDHALNFNKKKCIFDKDIHNQDAESIKQIDKQVLAKTERLDKSILFNNISIQNTQKIMGVETVTQRNSIHSGYDTTNIETFYPTDINNLKFTEIYLRKLYHDWIPNQIDSKCTSDLNFQRNLLGSLHNVRFKSGNLKSYPKTADGVRFTTLLSSCDAAGKIRQENKKHEEIISSKKVNKQKRDTSKTNAAVRILPKDSLEVFKRRKLYLNSNRTKWKCGNELLISVSSFNVPLNVKSPKSVKILHKPITILEDNMDNALQNKQLALPKEVQTDSDCKKIKEKSSNKDENEKNKLLIKKYTDSKSQIKEFNTGSRPIKEIFLLPPQNSNLKNAESNIPNDKNKIKSVSNDDLSNDTLKCSQKDKSCNQLLNVTHSHKNTEIKACQSTKQIKSLFKMPAFTKIRKQFLVDKKYSNEYLDGVKKGTKRWSNITDMLRISPLAQTFVRSDTASSPQNCFTTTKSKSKLLGFHFKKRPVVKNASKSCSTTHHTCECGSVGVDNETNCDIKGNNKNDVITLDKRIEQNTNTPSYLQKEEEEEVSHVCNKRNDSKNHLIEINLKLKPKQGVDKNIVISINDTSRTGNTEEIKEGVNDCTRQNKHFTQNKSGQSIREKTSKFFLNIKVRINNCKQCKGMNKKQSKTNKISKRISQKLQSTSSEMSKTFNNSPCSVHKCTVDLNNSFVNDNESYKYGENVTLLKLQNEDTSNSNKEIIERISDDTALESVCKNYNKKFINNYSIIKQGAVSNGQDEKIESYLNPKLNKRIRENFKSSKTAFKPSAHFCFYNKILSHNKMPNNEVKVKNEQDHSLAQQTIKKMFKCKKYLKENTKLGTIKEPVNLLQIVPSCDSSDQEDKTNHNERLIYDALQSNSSTFKTDRLCHFDSMLYSNKRNTVKFHNYYCNTVPQASKRHNAGRTIFKSESCLCNITFQNLGQDLKKSYSKQENCNILSNNINNDGDGNPFKVILPLLPNCTNSFHQPNDESEPSPVEVKCNIKEINAKEKRDIFELEEIKNAVLEMYITEKIEYDSDIFSTMPEVVSEVENVMILKTQP